MSTVPSEPKPQRFSRRTLLLLSLVLVPLLCTCCFIAILLNDSATEVEPTAVVEVEEATTEEEATDAPAATDEPIEATKELPPTEEPTPTNEPLPTELPASTAAPSPTTAPQPTVAPQPTATSPSLPVLGELRELTTDELALQGALDEVLGESNRALGRRLDMFTPGLPEFGANTIMIGWAADAAASNAEIRAGMAEDTLAVLRAIEESGLDYDTIFIGVKYLMMIEQLDMTDEVEVLTLNYTRDTLAGIDWSTITAGEVFEAADLFIIHPDFEE